MRVEKAFTLIELLVVVAIVAILATFSMGEYTQHVQNTRRLDAALALTDLAGFMERHNAIHGRYTAQGSSTEAPALPFSTVPQGSQGADVMYTIQFPTNPALTQTTYQLNAIPRQNGPQVNDRCGALTINNLGVRGMVHPTTGVALTLPVADCW